MKILTIKLNAPLQSYGNEATFSRRTTGEYPSKSAVIGMIAAALGYHRNDQRIEALNHLNYAVRIDQPGSILTDYQTVEWKPNTRKVTYRDYLQDAVFVAALGSSDDQLIEKIQVALKHPHFQLFLGRRSNAPAGVLQLHTTQAPNPISVLENLEWQASSKYQEKNRQSEFIGREIVADASLLPDQRSSMARDRVVSFDQRHRQHGYRPIAVKRVQLKNPHFRRDQPETSHDIMGFL